MNTFRTLGCNSVNTTSNPVVLVQDHWGSASETTNSGSKQFCSKFLTMCVHTVRVVVIVVAINTKSPTYSVLCFQGFRVKWEDHIWFWCCHKVTPNGVDADESIVCKVIENWQHPTTKKDIVTHGCDLLYGLFSMKEGWLLLGCYM